MSDQSVNGHNIAQYDWCWTFVAKCEGDCDDGCYCIDDELHAPRDVPEWDDWDGDVVEGPALCGKGTRQSIPGVGSRMGDKRCDDCCDLLGYPHGVGSPKNDAHLRAMLGMNGEGVR